MLPLSSSPSPPTRVSSIFLVEDLDRESYRKGQEPTMCEMKKRSRLVLLVLLLLLVTIHARHIGKLHSHDGRQIQAQDTNSTVKLEFYRVGRNPPLKHTVQVAGSSLPDCTHACGSCTPCRLVMVSFVCSSLEEAETCPMAYKCMCRNKSYPVP